MADHTMCVPMDHHDAMIKMFRARLADAVLERAEIRAGSDLNA